MFLHNIGNAKWNINNFEPKDVWRKKNKLRPRAIAIPTIFKHKVYDVIIWMAQLFRLNHLLHKNAVQYWKELK